MKNKILIFVGIASLMLFASCKVNTYYNEARYGNIVLDSLSRSDVEIVGSCTAEAMVTKSAQGLDERYAKQYKQGKFDDFLSVSAVPTNVKNSVLAKLFGTLKGAAVLSDPGRDFVMYALFEKYPDIDYFAGVTVDRVITTQGKQITEKLKVKAIGIKLKTDL